MNTFPTSTPRAHRRAVQRHLWSRRIRALLASGMVLGVGATITLAAWNDSEYTTGSVTAGHFSLEGSVDGDEYRSSEPDSAHTLSFSPDAALYPGATDYALFRVRASEGSMGGSVQVLADEENAEGLGAYLTYGIREVDGTTCTFEAFEAGEVVVERGSGLTTDAQTTQDLAPDQEEAINYCLELILPEGTDNDAQGLSATPSWEFFATSTSSNE